MFWTIVIVLSGYLLTGGSGKVSPGWLASQCRDVRAADEPGGTWRANRQNQYWYWKR